jgi:predicted nucleic acid-binding protein
MNAVFADTHYWLAVFNPKDSWAKAASAARGRLGNIKLITTDEVLTELLAAVSSAGPDVRVRVAKAVRTILGNPGITVIEGSRAGFLAALERYEAWRDKGYSLTDCHSMNVMDAAGIREVLTNDLHLRT